MKAQDQAKEELHHHQAYQRQKHPQKNRNEEEAGRINIDFYTDPLCCWSWALEDPWHQLLNRYAGITYRYIMCGMIPDWNTYNDAMNSVSRPLQMGPVWMHASEVTQVKMKYSIWHEDPPSSSYPACIAVKTAGLQSDQAGNKYLYEIRKALMENGANISKPQVLLSVAEQLHGDGFDFHQFSKDWKTGKGKEPFSADLKKSRFHNIGRYPTLTFQGHGGKGIMIVGYRPFEALDEAFRQMTTTGRRP